MSIDDCEHWEGISEVQSKAVRRSTSKRVRYESSSSSNGDERKSKKLICVLNNVQ